MWSERHPGVNPRVSGDAAAPHVAILTVTTNGAAHLPRFLEALERVTYRERSLWLVDNGSTDGSAELVVASALGANVTRTPLSPPTSRACSRRQRRSQNGRPR